MDKIKITEPNTGKHIAIAGDINSILASKEDDTYSVFEAKVFPNGGPIPHIQTHEHEEFYVLEGEITFSVDGKEIIAKRETFVNVPPYVIHRFKNKTEILVKMLVILAPGGLENLFVQVGNEVSDTITIHYPITNPLENKNSFIRIDDEIFSRQSLQTGETISESGMFTSIIIGSFGPILIMFFIALYAVKKIRAKKSIE